MKKKYWHSYTIQVNHSGNFYILRIDSDLLTPRKSEWDHALKQYRFDNDSDRKQVDGGWYVFTGHVCFKL